MTRALKWWIAVGLLLVFLAGAATGLFVGVWHAHRAFSDRHGRMMGARMREHLARQLDLTPEQLQAVDPILQETEKRLEAIRAETGQRVTQAMEEAHRDLAAHLTPEQMTKLEEMRKHHLQMRYHHGKHSPHLPPDAP